MDGQGGDSISIDSMGGTMAKSPLVGFWIEVHSRSGRGVVIGP